ncbi:MAG: hypothetical protein H6701_10830 [Myxococcales bacterium]|nr:hypothetical protein [Myxococcales bacterium]
MLDPARLAPLALLAALALAACDDPATAPDARPAADRGPTAPDATADATPDAAPDAIDAAPDAIDADPDAIDATPDAIDATPDAAPPAVCGDGALDPGEGCDDNNTDDGDGCAADCQPEAFAGDRVATAGAPGVAFEDIAPLPDGGWLVAGHGPHLDWLPADVPRAPLSADAIVSSAAPDRVGFLLDLAPDLGRIRRVMAFPPGTVEDITRVRVAAGVIHLSGRRTTADVQDSGYYIARLDAADAIDLVVNVRARPRRAGGFTGESDFRARQPWDVGPDGRVVYGLGAEYDFDWAAVEAIDATGARLVVPHWPAHWDPRGEWHGPIDDAPEPDAILYSAIVLKAGRLGSLRSRTLADYEAMTPDGNGGMRRGTWPDDYYFAGPCQPGGACPGGPGYTGYRTSDKPTQRLGGLVIDPRNGDLYLGLSTQSRLPDGNPDFEPSVVAFTADGRLKWWSRLYTEDDRNSSPDQYVDGLAIDAAHDRLVVLARCHGNNTVNLWSGDAIAAEPAARGFQNRFTGNSGNIHISWLGKLDLADGTLRAATYVAELGEGTDRAQPFPAEHPLAGQPNPNAGWPDLNTTRCRAPRVDAAGRVYLACTGRRTITTADAWQPMPPLGGGAGTWNEFVRVYTPDLSALVYSTLVTGDWDRETGAGGGNTRLAALAPAPGGVVTVGAMLRGDDGAPAGAPVPVTAPPPWAGEGDALMASFAIGE